MIWLSSSWVVALIPKKCFESFLSEKFDNGKNVYRTIFIGWKSYENYFLSNNIIKNLNDQNDLKEKIRVGVISRFKVTGYFSV